MRIKIYFYTSPSHKSVCFMYGVTHTWIIAIFKLPKVGACSNDGLAPFVHHVASSCQEFLGITGETSFDRRSGRCFDFGRELKTCFDARVKIADINTC